MLHFIELLIIFALMATYYRFTTKDLQDYLHDSRMTQSTMAELIGMQQQLLGYHLNKATDEIIKKPEIIKFLEENLEAKLDSKNNSKPLNHEKNGVPEIPLEAIGGIGESNLDAITPEMITMYHILPDFPEADVVFPIRGNSMKYKNGDKIACKFIEDTSLIQWGRRFVIDSASQGALFKRLIEKGENVECLSDNEDYKPFTLPKTDIKRLLLVLGSPHTRD